MKFGLFYFDNIIDNLVGLLALRTLIKSMGYKLKEINGLQNPLGSSIYKTPKQSLGYKTHERSASYD